MNRNVTILIIVLILLLLAGYLLWLRGRFMSANQAAAPTPTPTIIKVEATPPVTSQVIGTSSAEATKAGSPTPSKTKSATTSSSKVK